jgi:two-component system nitrate/nitrite response regulator NarL
LPEQLQHLTPRQLQIASLAFQGFSNKEVGRRLNVSEGTVKLHLHSIYTRLGLRNRTELASILFSLPGRHVTAPDEARWHR